MVCFFLFHPCSVHTPQDKQPPCNHASLPPLKAPACALVMTKNSYQSIHRKDAFSVSFHGPAGAASRSWSFSTMSFGKKASRAGGGGGPHGSIMRSRKRYRMCAIDTPSATAKYASMCWWPRYVVQLSRCWFTSHSLLLCGVPQQARPAQKAQTTVSQELARGQQQLQKATNYLVMSACPVPTYFICRCSHCACSVSRPAVPLAMRGAALCDCCLC